MAASSSPQQNFGLLGDLPKDNADLPRFSIPLATRPALKEKIQTTLDIIQHSCPLGQSIVQALGRNGTQILVFTDQMMNRFEPDTTRAFHAKIPGGHLLGMRESSLANPAQQFNLIREMAHESIHVRQRQDSPSDKWDPLRRNYVDNIIGFEKEAFAGTSEIMMRIALHEAAAQARTEGKPMSLRQTSVAQDWLRHVPEEAIPSLFAFEREISRGGRIEDGIVAVRHATLMSFELLHEIGYRQRATIIKSETQAALNTSVSMQRASSNRKVASLV